MGFSMNPRVLRVFSASLLCAGLVMAGVTVAGQSAGDAKAGGTVFETTCGNCHTVKAGKHKSGPSLFAVIGRQAGSEKNFEYSDALKQANITWTAESLNNFITNPKAMVDKTKMKFAGLSNETSRANLLAFLAEQQ